MRIRVACLGASLAGAILLGSCAEEAGPPIDEGVRVTLSEEMRIDPYRSALVPIGSPTRVAVARDGTIAIAQTQDAVVRFFDADGRPLGEVGGSGEGPGEFRQLWRLGWLGSDTLYAYDVQLRRFTLIGPDLDFARSMALPARARPSPELRGRIPEFRNVLGTGLYADGSVNARLTGPVGEETGEYDPDMDLHVRLARDEMILSYVQLPRAERIQIEMGDMILVTMAPVPTHPLIEISADGTWSAIVTREVEGPEAGTFQVTAESFDGEPLYTRHLSAPLVPITRTRADSVIDNFLDGSPADLEDAFRREVTFPPAFPPVAGIVPGRDRTLWVQLQDTEEGRPYRILDPHGALLGTVVVPTTTQIAVADLENVWTIERDPFDVETVVRYRLEGLPANR